VDGDALIGLRYLDGREILAGGVASLDGVKNVLHVVLLCPEDATDP
jgi:hypothetical protein